MLYSYLLETGDRKYDHIYSTVYYNNILTSNWIKKLQEDKIILKIKEYYNEDKGLQEDILKANESFFNRYFEKSKRRSEKCVNDGVKPFDAILGEN